MCWINDYRERFGMTTVLEEPADLLRLVGQRLGTTEWIQVTQRQVDQFAEATGDRQWIHTDPQRAAKGPFRGTIAHGYLTLSLAPVVISEVLEIRELTAALNYGLNKVRFPSPVRVGAQIRAVVTVMSAQQKTSGVESVFTLTYEIDGEDRPACVADVIVLYP
jgi:acyl dehydratase